MDTYDINIECNFVHLLRTSDTNTFLITARTYFKSCLKLYYVFQKESNKV